LNVLFGKWISCRAPALLFLAMTPANGAEHSFPDLKFSFITPINIRIPETKIRFPQVVLFEAGVAAPDLFLNSDFRPPQYLASDFNLRAQATVELAPSLAKASPLHCSTSFRISTLCYTEFASLSPFGTVKFDALAGRSILPRPPPKESFHWGPALWQSFEFLLLEHGFRLASDSYARYLLFHKPFWHDYVSSLNHFNMDQWGDGDSFLVNYIGHPMEGAVAGDIFLQNDPKGRSAKFGRSSAYWQSRLKAMVWSAAYSTYFEIGPVFSETALGNEGGYTYVPGCGLAPCTGKPGHHYKPATNNTGWVDFVVTPLVGTGWIVLEDVIETEFVDRLAKDSHAAKFNILRGALAPSRTLANALAGKPPWYRYSNEKSFAAIFGGPLQAVNPQPAWKGEPRWNAGMHYISLSLPMDREGCPSCRNFQSGGGFDFSYRVAQYLYFDSEANFFPGTSGGGSKEAAQEVLAGVKIGRTGRSWGIFSQIRPGIIHYDKTLVPGSSTVYEGTTRFAFDFGGSVEYYASRHSTFRVRVGTTFVHYLTDHTDPMQPPTSVLSDQYYALQGNFYLSSGYLWRF
jgi:hypothetical protein